MPINPEMPRTPRPDAESGFTLTEMVVSIALGAVVFTVLAMIMTTSLRTLVVQKSRTQGNEVATQGIEDLQRLEYDRLAVCQSPGGTVPSGLNDPVLTTNACGPNSRFDPCANAETATRVVPNESYICQRRATSYEVRRFVAWGANRTEKRLAVFVRWTDQSGPHEVSQQSSLRIPTRANATGLAPPQLSFGASGGVSPTPEVEIDDSGLLDETINLNATVSNPSPSGQGPDTVVASYRALEGGIPVAKTVELTWSNDADPSVDFYTGSIPADSVTFGQGSQYFTFTVIRKIDAKVNSRVVAPATRFCNATAGCPSDLPSITGSASDLDATPTTISIDAVGSLVSPTVRFSATTTNIRPDQSVSVVLQTLTGAVTVSLTPTNPGFLCDASTCVGDWAADISPSSGYLFKSGADRIYFQAGQTSGADLYERAQTAATDFGVTFQA